MTSIREQLIVADEALVKEVSFVKTVERTILDYNELKNYAVTQIPVAAVVGKLPETEVFKMSSRERETVDQIVSKLTVEVFVYFQRTTTEAMDITVSTYANELFAKLFENPTRGGLCLETLVKIEPEYAYWDPFVAFKAKAIHTYLHTTGGI